jgi:hypothetical protein
MRRCRRPRAGGQRGDAAGPIPRPNGAEMAENGTENSSSTDEAAPRPPSQLGSLTCTRGVRIWPQNGPPDTLGRCTSSQAPALCPCPPVCVLVPHRLHPAHSAAAARRAGRQRVARGTSAPAATLAARCKPLLRCLSTPLHTSKESQAAHACIQHRAADPPLAAGRLGRSTRVVSSLCAALPHCLRCCDLPPGHSLVLRGRAAPCACSPLP